MTTTRKIALAVVLSLASMSAHDAMAVQVTWGELVSPDGSTIKDWELQQWINQSFEDGSKEDGLVSIPGRPTTHGLPQASVCAKPWVSVRAHSLHESTTNNPIRPIFPRAPLTRPQHWALSWNLEVMQCSRSDPW